MASSRRTSGVAIRRQRRTTTASITVNRQPSVPTTTIRGEPIDIERQSTEQGRRLTRASRRPSPRARRARTVRPTLPLREEEPEIGRQPDREPGEIGPAAVSGEAAAAPLLAGPEHSVQQRCAGRECRQIVREGRRAEQHTRREPPRRTLPRTQQHGDARHAQHLRQREAARDGAGIGEAVAADSQQHRRDTGMLADRAITATRLSVTMLNSTDARRAANSESPANRAIPPMPRNRAADARPWRAGRGQWRQAGGRPAARAPRRR